MSVGPGEWDGSPVRIVTLHDLTARRQAEDVLRTRGRQHEAIAHLGIESLRASDLEAILQLTTREVAAVLEVEFCKVLRLEPESGRLLLAAGVGWKPGLVGVATVGAERESQAGYTLATEGPVAVSDLRRETRFRPPPLLEEHGILSGVSVAIPVRKGPWGVLGAHARTVRDFSAAETGFLQSVAALLSVTIERLAVEAAVARSERQLQAAQRIAQLGSWELDPSRGRLIWSEEMYRICGVDPTAFRGTHMEYLARVHPEDRARVEAALAASLQERTPRSLHYRLLSSDGRMKQVEERWQVQVDGEGRPVRVVGTCRDITDQKRQEELQACEARLLEAISSGLPLPFVLEKITRAVEVIVPGSIGSLLLVEPGGGRFRHGAAPGLPEAFNRVMDGLAIGPAAGSCGAAVSRREPAIAADIATDPVWSAQRDLALSHGLRACWALPVLDAAGAVQATIAFYLREPGGPAPEDLMVAARLARIVGLAIERDRDQAKLQASEERFRGTFLHAATGMAVTALDGRFLEVNAAYCRMLGYTEPELRALDFTTLTHPDDRPRNRVLLGELLAGGRDSFVFEKRYLHKSGGVVWCLLSVSAIRDADGRPTSIVGVAEDISERKRAEERVLRLNRVHALLSQINTTIVHVRERDQLFTEACRIAVETGGLPGAWIGVVDPETRAGRVAAAAGSARAFLADAGLEDALAADGPGLLGVALRECRHVVCSVAGDDPHCARWRGPALRHGYRSAAVFPLRTQGRCFGGFVLYAERDDVFDAEEIKLLNELADDVSFAVEFIGQESRRRQAEAALRESEERFRAVFAQAAVGICLVSLDNRFLRVNERFCAIVGHTHDELIGCGNCVDTTHPDDRATDAAAAERLRAGESSVALEKRYVRKDGGIVWAHLTLSMLRSPGGEAEQYVGVISDISARRLAEEERDRLFNHSLDLLGAFGLDGRIQQVNPAWTACLGWSAGELVGALWLDFVHPDDRAAAALAGKALAQGQAIRGLENRCRCKDGSHRWLLWNSHPIVDSGQVFAVAHDVTERRTTEEQLRLLETCVERINDIVLITEAEPLDEPGPRILYVNDAFVRRTGFTRAEAIGRTPRILQGPKRSAGRRGSCRGRKRSGTCWIGCGRACCAGSRCGPS
jgi:PAS domain S-box-containing protein